MKVYWVFSLESPHWGDFNEYAQYTIFKIKKNHPKLSQICNHGYLFLGTQERVRSSHGKRAISVRAIEVLLKSLVIDADWEIPTIGSTDIAGNSINLVSGIIRLQWRWDFLVGIDDRFYLPRGSLLSMTRFDEWPNRITRKRLLIFSGPPVQSSTVNPLSYRASFVSVRIDQSPLWIFA